MVDLGKLIFTVGLNDDGFKSGLKSDTSQLEAFGKAATATGKNLTKKLTLPIVGLGAAAIKLAADFEVSANKFAKAFEGSAEDAADSVEILNEQYGLAASEATSLLANTGDLLKGFGASSDAALELSTQTQKLAVSLAAYNGIPVAQASRAITSALTGERESLKTLGIVLKETDVTQRLAKKGQEDLTGQSLLLAKAQATLELSMEQSTDAIGSFADNQDSLAFQTSALKGDLTDLGVELGTILIPAVKDLVKSVSKGVKWFSNLDDGAQTAIVTMGLVVAAIGPVITMIGTATTAVIGLRVAMDLLAANPVVLGIVAVTAFTAGIVALGSKVHSNNIKRLSGELKGLADATGVDSSEMDEFVKKADRVEKAIQGMQMNSVYQGEKITIQKIKDMVDTLSSSLDLTKSQIVGIMENSDLLIDKDLESLGVVKNIVEAEEERARIEAERVSAKAAAEEARKQAAVDAYLNTLNSENAAIEKENALTKLRADAYIEYADAINKARIQQNLGLISAKEALEEGKDAAEDYADALIDAGYNGADATNAGDAALQDIVATIKNADAEIAALDEHGTLTLEEQTAARIAMENEWLQKRKDQTSTELELLEIEKQAAIAKANEVLASTYDIEAYYADKKKALEDKAKADQKASEEAQTQAVIDEASAKIAAMETAFGVVDSIMNTSSENWIDTVDGIADIAVQAALKSGNAYAIAAAAAVKAFAEVAKVIKAIGDAEEERAKLVADVEDKITAAKFEALKAEIDNEFDLKMAAIEKQEAAEIAAYVNTLSVKEQEALRSAGVIEETELQKIERETKAAIESGDAETVALLANEKKIAEIKAAADAKSEAAEKEYNNRMAKYTYDKAVSDKKARLIEIEAEKQSALASLKWWQWIAGYDRDVKSVYGQLSSTIAGLTIPDPVYLANGGIVNPTNGGTNAVIGEAGDQEAVVPLNDAFFNRLAAAATATTQGTVTSTSTNSKNTVINVVLDGRTIGSSTVQLINNKVYTIDARSVR